MNILVLLNIFWSLFSGQQSPVSALSSAQVRPVVIQTITEKEASQPRPFRIDNTVEPKLNAAAGAVWSVADERWLFENNIDAPRSIASITKLMSMLVFLDHNPGWEIEHEITAADRRDGGKIYLYKGDIVSIQNLFEAVLVGSDNTAVIALINSSGLTEDQFVAEMNAKAKSLGLLNTSFDDAVGLSPNNISTARDIVKLAQTALSREEIATVVSKTKTEFKTKTGVKKSIESTDYLLGNLSVSGFKIFGGKTGYTDAAGYCFVGKFRDNQGRDFFSVVLGAPTERERFRQTEALINWINSGWSW